MRCEINLSDTETLSIPEGSNINFSLARRNKFHTFSKYFHDTYLFITSIAFQGQPLTINILQLSSVAASIIILCNSYLQYSLI